MPFSIFATINVFVAYGYICTEQTVVYKEVAFKTSYILKVELYLL